MRSRITQIPVRFFLWTAAVIAVMQMLVQLLLSPKILTPIIVEYANHYIDADVSLGGVSVNIVRHFPNLTVSIDSCLVSYSSDRFGEYLSRSDIMEATRTGSSRDTSSGSCDTLAQMARFRATVNPFALLHNTLRIKQISITGLNGYAHRFDSACVNWDILKNITPKEENGTSNHAPGSLPTPVIGRITLDGRHAVIYTDEVTGSVGMVTFKSLDMKGNRGSSEDLIREFRIGLDSMLIYGSQHGNSAAVSIEKLRLMSTGATGIAGDISAGLMASGQYGQISLPLLTSFKLDIPHNKPDSLSIESFEADVCGIPLSVRGGIGIHADSIYVDAAADIKNWDIGQAVTGYGVLFFDFLRLFDTDATLNLHAAAKGYFVPGTKSLPSITAGISIPEATILYDSKDIITLRMACSADNLHQGTFNASIDTLSISDGRSTCIGLSGVIHDILGEDPLVTAGISVSSDLTPWSDHFGSDTTFRFSGNMSGDILAKFRFSQINMRHIAEADIQSGFHAAGLRFTMPSDSIDITADTVTLHIGAAKDINIKGVKKGSRVLLASASVDTALVRLGNGLETSARNLSVDCHGNAAILSGMSADTLNTPRYYASVSADRLSLMDRDSTKLTLHHTSNSLIFATKEGNDTIPVITLTCRNGGVSLTGHSGRFAVRNLVLEAGAEKNYGFRSGHQFSSGKPRILQERTVEKDDFTASDYTFNMGESFKKMYRIWTARGDIRFRSAALKTPRYPIRTTIRDLGMSFSTNALTLGNLSVESGDSKFRLDGKITGLRRMLLNNGILKTELNLDASALDLNQIIAAVAVGSEATSSSVASDRTAIPEVSADEVVTMAEDVRTPLLIIPSFMDAAVKVTGKNIKFSDMLIDSLTTLIEMQQRCLRISRIAARTNMGALTLEGYYATRSKKDISAGINLGLSGVTASEVIGMIPSMDTLLPMLKTFDGRLNCYVAGTTRLDTCMNVILPTATGVLRFGGDSLYLEQNARVKKITRMLMFRNKQDLRINKMSVEAQLNDSRIEVFPFILDIDRYKLAASGIHNLDNSYKYHISVIKSPLPFRLGIDLFGDDFDDNHFRLVRPKYKNEEKIPVFSSTIDDTRLNISEMISDIFSIGVDRVVHDSTFLNTVKKRKKQISYVSVSETASETISEKELEDMKEKAEMKEEQDKEDTSL